MVKPVSEFEEGSMNGLRDSVDGFTVHEDPVDAMVEDLRSEFRRGMRRETAKDKAAKRMRRRLLIAGLAVLAGAILTTALVEFVMHPRSAAHSIKTHPDR